jgi:GH15 family glucan-1,4-alpha-glucosidase
MREFDRGQTMGTSEPRMMLEGLSAWDRQDGIEPQARIEEHGLIGDMQTAALVTTDGAIDWLCLPRFDSEACFVSLLGSQENGRWRIAPVERLKGVRRQYRPDTLILETEFLTEHGQVQLVDFMPPRHGAPHVVRRVKCIEGEVRMRSDCMPRFGFGRDIPRVIGRGGATVAFVGPDALYLRGGPSRERPPLEEEYTMHTGDQVVYDLSWADSFGERPDPIDTWGAELDTEEFWKTWCAHIHAPEKYRESVIRSLITLKACTYAPTGGIVAAPTTSLPETYGGSRNWDYRFTWLRDASITCNAFIDAGFVEEGRSFLKWLIRAVAGDPSQLQIMYGIRANRRLTEVEVPWLSGYGGSGPVRLGNGAFDQFQLDIFGEFAATAYHAFESIGTGAVSEEGLAALLGAARFVEKKWMEKDHGIWEMRGPLQNFVASQVSAWTAVDRASRVLTSLGRDPALAEKYAQTANRIKESVLRDGFNAELNTFTQYPGSKAVDASLLIIPLLGFLPATDPRVLGTIAAIERELIQDGLVLRYRTETNVDGLEGQEGTFLACSFWLAQAYQLAGRHEDARRLFDRLLGIRNDLGLFSEEYDPANKRQLGNFPQAFSHMAMVHTAYTLHPTSQAPKAEG